MNRLTYVVGFFLLFASLITNAYGDLNQELKVGQYVLKLNGQGTRSKAFIQVYESGLYLLTPTQSPKVILESDELMAIRIRITSGLISRDSLAESLQESLARSTGGNPDAIAKETQMLIEFLKDEVNKNDVFDFVYVPNQGLFVIKNGNRQASYLALRSRKLFSESGSLIQQ